METWASVGGTELFVTREGLSASATAFVGFNGASLQLLRATFPIIWDEIKIL